MNEVLTHDSSAKDIPSIRRRFPERYIGHDKIAAPAPWSRSMPLFTALRHLCLPEPRTSSSIPDGVARLVTIRWWVLGILLVGILSVPKWLNIALPLQPMLMILVCVATWNALLHLHATHAKPAGQLTYLGQLNVDVLSFSALLYFSGGATNPLVFLLLVPVVLAALLLSRRAVVTVTVLSVMTYSLLMVRFIPLPFSDPERAATLHLLGMWMTFVVSAAMLAWFIMRTTSKLRQHDAELARAREQTLRNERVLALGALAAGAAHELGTPLATLAVLAGELAREAPSDSPAASDLKLMREQIAYCKRIITQLTEQAGDQRSEGAEPMRCDVWLEGLHAAWRSLRQNSTSSVRIGESSHGDGPMIVVEPTLGHSIVNLLDNALRAGAPVEISLDWDTASLHIVVQDSGPGFPPDVVAHAGRKAFGSSSQGSGIGLLITAASLERLGGSLVLENRAEGGARAHVTLPLNRIGIHE